MRLLLDEMWAPAIAVELRKRRFDVVAINEQPQSGRYAGAADDHVFAPAQEDRRGESHGSAHYGVIYALDPPFNRHRGDTVIGRVVNALEHFLSSSEAAEEPSNRVHYLRPVPID